MYRVVLFAVIAVAVTAGCKKSKPTAPDSAPPPPVTPVPAPTGGTPSAGGNVGVIPSGAGGGVVTNPGGLVGGGGGGGAAQAVRKAVRRTQALNELKNLGEFIAELQDPFGKMPTKEQILASLKTGAPAIYKAIDEGSFILTGTTQAGGLWAYEVDADKTPGIAVIGGRATRSTPEEVQQYLKTN